MRHLLRCLAVVGLALAPAGTAFAEPTDAPPPPPPSAVASSAVLRIDASRLTVRRWLQTARAVRDAKRAACLDDQLNQIDVTARRAREAGTATDAATRAGDAPLASREAGRAVALAARGDRILADARLCLGPAKAPVDGVDSRRVVVPPLPPDEPLTPSKELAEPPGCTSCFK